MNKQKEAALRDDMLFDVDQQPVPLIITRRMRWYGLLHSFGTFVLILVFFAAGFLLGGVPSLIATGAACLFSWVLRPHIAPNAVLTHFQARPIAHVFAASTIPRMVADISDRANLPTIPHVYGIHSATANAFAVGNKDNIAVLVSDGLMGALTARQLRTVLAHEISHLRSADLRLSIFLDTLAKMTAFVAVLAFFLVLWRGPELSGASTLWFGLMLGLPGVGFMIVTSLGRLREVRADIGAVALTGDPVALAQALSRLEYVPIPWYRRIFGSPLETLKHGLFRSHPSISKRTQRLYDLMRETG